MLCRVSQNQPAPDAAGHREPARKLSIRRLRKMTARNPAQLKPVMAL